MQLNDYISPYSDDVYNMYESVEQDDSFLSFGDSQKDNNFLSPEEYGNAFALELKYKGHDYGQNTRTQNNGEELCEITNVNGIDDIIYSYVMQFEFCDISSSASKKHATVYLINKYGFETTLSIKYNLPKDLFCWDFINKFFTFTNPDTIEHYKNYINWETLSFIRAYDDDFLKEYSDKINHQFRTLRYIRDNNYEKVIENKDIINNCTISLLPFIEYRFIDIRILNDLNFVNRYSFSKSIDLTPVSEIEKYVTRVEIVMEAMLKKPLSKKFLRKIIKGKSVNEINNILDRIVRHCCEKMGVYDVRLSDKWSTVIFQNLRILFSILTKRANREYVINNLIPFGHPVYHLIANQCFDYDLLKKYNKEITDEYLEQLLGFVSEYDMHFITRPDPIRFALERGIKYSRIMQIRCVNQDNYEFLHFLCDKEKQKMINNMKNDNVVGARLEYLRQI